MNGLGRTIACFGCGAQVADIDDPTHAYILSAPGCWGRYGEVLAAELSEPARWPAHQLSVDAYAVQHPSNPDGRNRQSVAVHLVSLCLLVEQQLPPERAPVLRAALLEGRRTSGFPGLDPLPAPATHRTVVDVAGAPTPAEHVERVRRWATSAWQAWDHHHDMVRARADEISPRGGVTATLGPLRLEGAGPLLDSVDRPAVTVWGPRVVASGRRSPC